MSRALALLKLTRFPLVFTAMADSVAGYFLTVQGPVRGLSIGTVAALSGCFYAAGMAYNDIADYARDRILHPERPLPGGRVSRDAAHFFAKALLLIGAGGTCLFGVWASLWAMAMLVLILGYNFWLKAARFPGAAAMALIRGMNLGLGAFAAAHLVPGAIETPNFYAFPWIPMATLATYVFLLTLVSTYEETDATRNRIGGLGLAMSLAPLITVLRPVERRWAPAIPAVFIFMLSMRAALIPSRERIMQLVRWGVLAIILIDASFVACAGRGMEALMIAGLVLPALALLPLFRKL